MSYQSWSVVFSEQPSAAKWNILGTNDATFNTLLGTYGVRNPYCFRAYDSGGTTLTDGGFVKINLATEDYDYNNNFTGSTYTAPLDGVYHFDGTVSQATGSTTPAVLLAVVYINGALAIRSSSLPITTTGVPAGSVSGDFLMTAGQTAELYYYQDSAGNEATDTGSETTWFSGHLVHAT